MRRFLNNLFHDDGEGLHALVEGVVVAVVVIGIFLGSVWVCNAALEGEFEHKLDCAANPTIAACQIQTELNRVAVSQRH